MSKSDRCRGDGDACLACLIDGEGCGDRARLVVGRVGGGKEGGDGDTSCLHNRHGRV